jgi:chorismate mutase
MTAHSPEDESLGRLRQEIESIDRSLVLLLAARLHAARRALRVRVGQERRLTDRAQERRVLERSRRWAEELGLPPKFVEGLFRALMEEGKVHFQTSEGSSEPPVVTVLLEGPEGAPRPFGQDPRLQLLPVPPSG